MDEDLFKIDDEKLLSLIHKYNLLDDQPFFERMIYQLFEKDFNFESANLFGKIQLLNSLTSSQSLTSTQNSILCKKIESLFSMSGPDAIQYSLDCPIKITSDRGHEYIPCTYLIETSSYFNFLYYINSKGKRQSYSFRGLDDYLSTLSKSYEKSEISAEKQAELMQLIVNYQKNIVIKEALKLLFSTNPIKELEDLSHIASRIINNNISLLLKRHCINQIGINTVLMTLEKLNLNNNEEVSNFLINDCQFREVNTLNLYITCAKKYNISAEIIKQKILDNLSSLQVNSYSDDYELIFNHLKNYDLLNNGFVAKSIISLSRNSHAEFLICMLNQIKSQHSNAELYQSLILDVQEIMDHSIHEFEIPVCDSEFLSIIKECKRYQSYLENNLFSNKTTNIIKDNFISLIEKIANSKTHTYNPVLFHELISVNLNLFPEQIDKLDRLITLFKFNSPYRNNLRQFSNTKEDYSEDPLNPFDQTYRSDKIFS